MPLPESALVFDCNGARLLAVLHPASRTDGVIIVTGGPQYRVGSHRQFVLLARRLADLDYPSLRFDCRGMGDSEGAYVGFEMIADDIRAAVDELVRQQPHVRRVFLWGLCDAASAIMMSAAEDERVTGLVLLNPWARTEAGEAKAVLTHYYGRRLLSSGFWRDLFAGRVSLSGALSSVRRLIGKAAGSKKEQRRSAQSFLDRMEVGIQEFEGPVLLVISGDDLTAAEFMNTARNSAGLRSFLNRKNVQIVNIPDANHTFSRESWRRAVEDATLNWLESNHQ